jgi:hypothetical protein
MRFRRNQLRARGGFLFLLGAGFSVAAGCSSAPPERRDLPVGAEQSDLFVYLPPRFCPSVNVTCTTKDESPMSSDQVSAEQALINLGCGDPVTYYAPCGAEERATTCPWTNLVSNPDGPPPNAAVLHWMSIHSGMNPAPGAADAHFAKTNVCDACLAQARSGTIWVFWDAPLMTNGSYCPKGPTPTPLVNCPGGCMDVW